MANRSVALLVNNLVHWNKSKEAEETRGAVDAIFGEYLVVETYEDLKRIEYESIEEVYVFGKQLWAQLTGQKEGKFPDVIDGKRVLKYLTHYNFCNSTGGFLSPSFKANQDKLLNSKFSKRDEPTSYNLQIVDQSQLIRVISDFSDEPVDSDHALDVEANDFRVWSSHFKLLGFSVVSNAQAYYIVCDRDFSPEEKRSLTRYLYARRPWAYNCKFERSVFWKLLGVRVDFNDSWALCKINGAPGSLKDNSVKFLNVKKWNTEVEDIVDAADAVFEYFPRMEERGTPEIVRAVLNPKYSLEDVKDVIIESKSRLKRHCLNKLEALQVVFQGDSAMTRAALLKYPFAWETIPTETLATYCGLDSLNTLKLKEKLYDEESAKSYPYFLRQSYLACSFESYGICCDDTEALRLRKIYLGKQIETLQDLIGLLDLPDEQKERAKAITGEPTSELLSRVKEIFNPGSTGASAQVPYWNIFKTSASISYVIQLWLERQLTAIGAYDSTAHLFVRGDLVTTLKNLSEHAKDSKYGKNINTMISRFHTLTGETKKVPVLDENGDKVIENGVAVTEEKTTRGELFDGFKKEILEFHFQAYLKYCVGFEIDDPETWPVEFKILYLLKTYKKLDKLISTYIDGSLGFQNMYLARVTHPSVPPDRIMPYSKIPEGYERKPDEVLILNTSFKENVANTRRWTAGFHTIPAGAELRRIFIPRSDKFLMGHFDYSQQEIRVLSSFAQETDLINAFLAGEDIHRFIASFVYGKPASEITSEERSFSKAASFSIVYGKTLENFAADFMKGDMEKTLGLFDTLFTRFPRLKDYIEKMKRVGVRDGVVKSMFGDSMVVLEPGRSSRKALADAERYGVNYPIQNTGSAVSALSIESVDTEMYVEGIDHCPLGFVHDSADFEFETSKFFPYIDLLDAIAVQKARKEFNIPVDIEWAVGPNMYDQVEMKERKDKRTENRRTFKFKAPQDVFDALSRQLRTEFDVSEEINSSEERMVSYDMLFAPKAPYSLNIGKKRTFIKGELCLEQNTGTT